MTRAPKGCLPLLAPVMLALALVGCGHHSKVMAPGPQPADSTQVADFSLTDVNPNSPTTNQAVSPRQYTGKISAWYFGHAT